MSGSGNYGGRDGDDHYDFDPREEENRRRRERDDEREGERERERERERRDREERERHRRKPHDMDDMGGEMDDGFGGDDRLRGNDDDDRPETRKAASKPPNKMPGLSAGKKVTLLLLGLMFLLVAYNLYNSFSGRARREDDESKKYRTIPEAELLEYYKEREALQNRIKVLENARSEQIANLQARLGEIVGEELAKERARYEAQMAEARQREDELRDELRRLAEERARPPEPEPTPTPPNYQGSVAPMMVHADVELENERFAEKEAAAAQVEPSRWAVRAGMRRGLRIPGILRTGIVSAFLNEKFLVEIETEADTPVKTGGIVALLPKGARFIGVAIPDLEARRIFVAVESLQVGDVEMLVSGDVLDGNGRPGLVSKYLDPLEKALWSTALPSFLAAAADVAQEYGQYVNREGDVVTKRLPTAENAAYAGFANMSRRQAAIMQEISQKKKPVIIVNRDLPVEVRLVENVPLADLIASGVLKDTRARP